MTPQMSPEIGKAMANKEVSETALPVTAVASPKLRSTKLDFFYGAYQALHDINLDVFAQKVTAFIGPSGCGKSTFLRTLNRMN